jgi:hypothetical protein
MDRAALVQVRGAAHPQRGAFRQHVAEGPAGVGDGGFGDFVDGNPGFTARRCRAAAALGVDQLAHGVVPSTR